MFLPSQTSQFCYITPCCFALAEEFLRSALCCCSVRIRHATALHLQAAAEWPELQESVAKLCVAWWQADAPGKEALVTQTLPYLLVRALSTSKACPLRTQLYLL